MKSKTELGIFIKSPNAEIIECCGIAGIDFVVIDMEHTPLGPRDLYPLILAAEVRKLKLIIRLPNLNEEYFKWCLDLGVKHLQIPQIETMDNVNIAINNSFYNPIGERGLCRFVRAANYSNKDKELFIRNSNNDVKLIFQIEGEKGFNNLDKIIINKNVTNIFIGPYDLSQSLGFPGDIWNEQVIRTIKEIIRKCKDNSIKVGIFTDTIDGIHFWKKQNVDFIEYGSDLLLLSQALKNLISIK
tara:strand:+ start:742 stop:1470 length:729 start_codon:yes stop_codon:yes gene_type:complete